MYFEYCVLSAITNMQCSSVRSIDVYTHVNGAVRVMLATHMHLFSLHIRVCIILVYIHNCVVIANTMHMKYVCMIDCMLTTLCS